MNAFIWVGILGICTFPYCMIAAVYSKSGWFFLWFVLSIFALASIFIGASLENA